MTTIIAGGFATNDDAQRAMTRLRERGVSEDSLCGFRVNPPGEHDGTPIGGDHPESPGATHAGGGSLKGAAIGAVAGAAAGAVASTALGPVAIAGGAGVGAYTGALQVEQAEGTWSDGEWSDFNPTTPPHLIHSTSDVERRSPPP